VRRKKMYRKKVEEKRKLMTAYAGLKTGVE